MGVRGGGVSAPTTEAALDDLHERLSDKERRTTPVPATPRVPFTVTIQHQGPVTAAVSDPWPVPWTGRLQVVRFQATAAGPGDLTLTVNKSGTPLTPLGAGSTTITLPNGVTDETSVQFDDMFLRLGGGIPADIITIETLTGIAGWSGLVCVPVFG